MKKDINTKVLSFIIAFILIPKNAFASGDPIFLYGLISIGVLHFTLGICFIVFKSFSGYKILLIAIYAVNVAISWFWAMGYHGPHFSGMFIGLIGGPLITFLCLNLLFKRKKGSNLDL